MADESMQGTSQLRRLDVLQAHLSASLTGSAEEEVAHVEPCHVAGTTSSLPNVPVSSTESLSAEWNQIPRMIDHNVLKRYLDGPHHQFMETVREFFLKNPEYAVTGGLPLEEQRRRTFFLARKFMRELPTIDFNNILYDVARAFAAGEANANAMNSSMLVRLGVHIWLAGGSIGYLGTPHQRDTYFPGLADFSTPACFAMSEIGHGSNVRLLQTEARFDPSSGEFVIVTPCPEATKIWIGGALTSVISTVFARLLTPAQRLREDLVSSTDGWELGKPLGIVERDGIAYHDHGIHGFIVNLRDEKTGQVLSGIKITDLLEKMGCNGIENCAISFDHVRIPRDRLLSRYGNVLPNGTYISPIPDANRRFNTMLSALFFTRVTLTSNGISMMQIGLNIALRYSFLRRAFGPPGGEEVPVITYLSQKLRLIPPLAASYALFFTSRYVQARWIGVTDQDRREVEALVSGFKSYALWRSIEALQNARECCGGQGYLYANMIAAFRMDADVFVTLEGDNTVLCQQVAKDLLTQYRKQMQGSGKGGVAGFTGMLSFLTEEIQEMVMKTNPLYNSSTSESAIRNTDFYLTAFRYREGKLLRSLAMRLRRKVQKDLDAPFDAWNDCLDHIQNLAEAHIERICLEQFLHGVLNCPDEDIRTALSTVFDLYALDRMNRSAAFYLENGFMGANRAKAVRSLVRSLCDEVLPYVPDLLDALGFPDQNVRAPILRGNEGVIDHLKLRK